MEERRGDQQEERPEEATGRGLFVWFVVCSGGEAREAHGHPLTLILPYFQAILASARPLPPSLHFSLAPLSPFRRCSFSVACVVGESGRKSRELKVVAGARPTPHDRILKLKARR